MSTRFKYELAQLYLDAGEDDKALSLFEDLREGAYSLVALAALGTVAERKGDLEGALAHWKQMLKETRVGDPLWFRGTYDVARAYHARGDTAQACRTIRPAANMIARLRNESLKRDIEQLGAEACGK